MPPDPAQNRPALPHALHDRDVLEQALDRRRPQIFLDYDGTLTPIVPRPEDAVLAPATRAAVARLAARYPVAVISGRQLADVRALVGLPELYYAGDHGFEIAGPEGFEWQFGQGYVDELASLHRQLVARLPQPDGLLLEQKRYSLSIHYRLVEREALPPVEQALTAILAEHPRLRLRAGKQVFEIRPHVDWHKGKAVRKLMEILGADRHALPIFIGDDVTDEDAFEELRPAGLGILVSEDPRPTAAAFRLHDPDEVRALLDYLADRPPP